MYILCNNDDYLNKINIDYLSIGIYFLPFDCSIVYVVGLRTACERLCCQRLCRVIEGNTFAATNQSSTAFKSLFIEL